MHYQNNYSYIKDRTKSFDDYFAYRKNNCKLEHVMNWMNLLSVCKMIVESIVNSTAGATALTITIPNTPTIR
jgi:hypothetical protein